MQTGRLLSTPAIGYYRRLSVAKVLKECFLEHCYKDSRVVTNWSLHFSSFFVNDFINNKKEVDVTVMTGVFFGLNRDQTRVCLRARSVSKAINTC